ncbi:MAG: hypothetical protein WCL02_08465 [bacterium]
MIVSERYSKHFLSQKIYAEIDDDDNDDEDNKDEKDEESEDDEELLLMK